MRGETNTQCTPQCLTRPYDYPNNEWTRSWNESLCSPVIIYVCIFCMYVCILCMVCMYDLYVVRLHIWMYDVYDVYDVYGVYNLV